MSIRMLVWILLIGAASANAAPTGKHAPVVAPTSTPPAAADIDVNAMARAKDVGGSNDAAAIPPTDTGNAAATQPAQVPAPVAAPTQAQSPAPATISEPADPVQVPLSPLAPAAAPVSAERRLAASCEARATSLLDAAQKGDYATATRDFDAKMRAGLPVAKFRQAWESLAQFGRLTARGQAHPATNEGYVAITIPLIFEKANLYTQVTCGSDGRIAGFYVKPLDVPTP